MELVAGYFGRSGGERQHRRLTWAQRLRWNQLPADVEVTLTSAGDERLAELLLPPPSRIADKAA